MVLPTTHMEDFHLGQHTFNVCLLISGPSRCKLPSQPRALSVSVHYAIESLNLKGIALSNPNNLLEPKPLA